MSDKKHIDRLFQEKLKDLEITPDNSVWKSIQTELNKKKKERRVIPLWFKLSGIAAGIILLIALGSSLLKDSQTISKETIVDTPIKNENSETKKPNTQITNKDFNLDKTETVETNNNLDSESQQSIINQIKEEQIADLKNKTASPKTNKNLNKLSKDDIDKSFVDSDNNKQNKLNVVQEKNITNSDKNKELIENSINNIENSITDSNLKEEESNKDKLKEEALVEKEANAITDAIAANENKEELKIDEESKNRWSVNPNIAPVYFNSIGNGSSIDSQFNNNSKTGKINMSFGVNASYAINDKLNIRTGVNKVDLGYVTNNVVVLSRTPSSTALINENTYKNINFTNSNKSISLLNIDQSFEQTLPRSLPNKLQGELGQEFGFIEVPVEVEYKLLNTKFGMSVIGGFSTLFLNNNEIYSISNGEKTLLGEATNIKNTSFSANLGLGVNYNITKNINLNVEPTFKYQINTFDNTSGEFNPYFIGIYSGIKYKF